jgi:hypothetical protein
LRLTIGFVSEGFFKRRLSFYLSAAIVSISIFTLKGWHFDVKRLFRKLAVTGVVSVTAYFIALLLPFILWYLLKTSFLYRVGWCILLLLFWARRQEAITTAGFGKHNGQVWAESEMECAIFLYPLSRCRVVN